MDNESIARRFYRLAALMDIRGDDPFRLRSYRNAAEAIETWPTPLKQIADDDGIAGLQAIPGVGKAIAGKILELDFFSRCDESVCKPEPCHDSDETKRNDFYFMRKVLDLPGGLPKYSFALAEAADKPAPFPATCHRLTDEAPCAGAGYGGGGCTC